MNELFQNTNISISKISFKQKINRIRNYFLLKSFKNIFFQKILGVPRIEAHTQQEINGI